MEKKFKLEPIRMPNFIRIEMPAGKRQDGFKQSPTISIHDLSEHEAKEYAELLKTTFLEHWKKSTNHE